MEEKDTPYKEDGDMDVKSPEQVADMEVTSFGVDYPLGITPCQVDKNLDFVAISKKGKLLLGSSNLTGRYWGGSLWYFDNPAYAPNIEQCVVGYEAGSGLPDGTFINERVFIIGQDCGTVKYMKLSADEIPVQLSCSSEATEHCDAISCVQVTCTGTSTLTGSADMSIILWDNETTSSSRTLSIAHSQQITGISPHPTNEEMFLSSGMDGNVLLWDLRCTKPASCIYRDWDNKPECVAWIDDSRYVLGLQNGQVALCSTTELNWSIATYQALSRPLFRVVANPLKPSSVAVCGNDSKVVVLDINGEQIQERFVNDLHKDFVRGLAWIDADSFVSCGWDSSVKIHQIK